MAPDVWSGVVAELTSLRPSDAPRLDVLACFASALQRPVPVPGETLGPREGERRRVLWRWLVRTAVPEWLEAAEHGAVAERLRGGGAADPLEDAHALAILLEEIVGPPPLYPAADAKPGTVERERREALERLVPSARQALAAASPAARGAGALLCRAAVQRVAQEVTNALRAPVDAAISSLAAPAFALGQLSEELEDPDVPDGGVAPARRARIEALLRMAHSLELGHDAWTAKAGYTAVHAAATLMLVRRVETDLDRLAETLAVAGERAATDAARGDRGFAIESEAQVVTAVTNAFANDLLRTLEPVAGAVRASAEALLQVLADA